METSEASTGTRLTSAEHAERVRAAEARLSEKMRLEEEAAERLKALVTMRDNKVLERDAIQAKIDELEKEMEISKVRIEEASRLVEVKRSTVSATYAELEAARSAPYLTDSEANSLRELRGIVQAKKMKLLEVLESHLNSLRMLRHF